MFARTLGRLFDGLADPDRRRRAFIWWLLAAAAAALGLAVDELLRNLPGTIFAFLAGLTALAAMATSVLVLYGRYAPAGGDE